MKKLLLLSVIGALIGFSSCKKQEEIKTEELCEQFKLETPYHLEKKMYKDIDENQLYIVHLEGEDNFEMFQKGHIEKDTISQEEYVLAVDFTDVN